LLESLIERQNSSSTSETGPAAMAGVFRRFGRATRRSRSRIEIHRTDQVGVAPRQLVLVGSSLTWARDLGHRLLEFSTPGEADIGHQRAGERAVGADLAVERGLSGPVAKAISVPSPDFISARPDCT